MSNIPNARNKYRTKWNGEVTDEENACYEGNLSQEHKASIIGYDYSVEEIDSFFCNLDVYHKELSGLIDLDLVHEDVVINDKLDFRNLTPGELLQYSKETRLLAVLRSCLRDWLEAHRNEIIISMLDKQESNEE